MKSTTVIGALFALSTLLSCSEWRTFVLKNPKTGAEAVCATDWGSLTDEDVQRLLGCIHACEARGFQLKSPESVPPARPPVSTAKPPSIPLACQE